MFDCITAKICMPPPPIEWSRHSSEHTTVVVENKIKKHNMENEKTERVPQVYLESFASSIIKAAENYVWT